MNAFLKPDGSPDVTALITSFTRSNQNAPGGLAWVDQIRDCRWPGQFSDGRKHDVHNDPNGKAKPWNGASDCRPFVVDDIINELVDVDVVSFWRSMLQQGSAGGESDSYAVALVENLIFTKMFDKLLDEVELSSQYRHQYGWCVLAPRWNREIGLRRYTLTMSEVATKGAQAAQMLQQAQAELSKRPDVQIPQNAQAQITKLQATAQLPNAIQDPALEDEAVQYLQQWYNDYVAANLPADLQDRAPKMDAGRIRQCVRDLRNTGTCTAPLPYRCKNEPEIAALKPFEEVAIPPELTDANEVVFQIEWVSEATLKGREITENYDPDWVAQAIKHKGISAPNQTQVATQPVGLNGLLAGGASGVAPMGDVSSGAPGVNSALIRLVHAMYREADADGIPGVYVTTFHTDVTKDKQGNDLFAKHGLMDGAGSDLPNVQCLRERRTRAMTASRGVPETAHTDQNLIKGIRDGIIDRQSITLLPPVNIFESPTGAKYEFGPAVQNYVKRDKEPEFMQMPSGSGLADGVETHNLVTTNLDSRFGRMSPNVQPQRIQTAQENRTRRFLVAWTKAIKWILVFYQQYGDDVEFSDITGAPLGWLEQRRQTPGLLTAALDFDARELDPDLMLKRIETMNNIVLPSDVMGVINRSNWAAIMTRSVMGPAIAKQLVQSMPAASQALMDKANMEVLKMFAGNPPNYVDDKDPTAANLLQYTQQIVMQNPNYLKALTDEALMAVAGQNAAQLAQQIGKRNPDPIFSGYLMKWLKNLQFIGVTQVQNKQTGAIGVNPNETAATAAAGS